MNYCVQIRGQVWKYYERLGPQDRREVKRAILHLSSERGDIRPLRDRLEGYYRLRVGSYRIIYRYLAGRVIECVYMNDRSLVYDVFESELHRIITEKSNS